MPGSDTPGLGFKALSLHLSAMFYPHLNQKAKRRTARSLGTKGRQATTHRAKSQSKATAAGPAEAPSEQGWD